MDKNAVLEVLSHFRKSLETNGITVNKLILYGSYATGNYKEGSDIDIIVVSDDFIGKNHWERIDILSNAIYEVFAPIEAIGLTLDEWGKNNLCIVDDVENIEVLYA